MKDKFIIVELIPEAIDPSKGSIVQLSAIKIDGIKLIDRFDYRLNEDKIIVKDLLSIINYDKDLFTYVDNDKKIINDFNKFIEDYKLLIIDNQYTLNFLKDIKNQKESVFKYLNMEYSDDAIDMIIKKYDIKPTNYIVDILYEALIYESK